MTTLRRKLAMQIALLIAALLLAGGAALWGLQAQRADFGSALADYRKLQTLYHDVGSRVQSARTLLDLTPPQTAPAQTELRHALDVFTFEFPSDSVAAPAERDLNSALSAALTQSVTTLDLDPVFKSLADLDVYHRRQIESLRGRADDKLRWTMEAAAALLAAAALAAILLGIVQYRTVMRPLSRLHGAVARIATGRLDERIPPENTAEFADLALHFNRMAAELAELYTNLQRKVDEASKQLVRSERLAGVGFLAAGVAHEINNPLSIMTAHAELALAQLQNQSATANDPAALEAQRALAIICDEAFRCKRIVQKLLSFGQTDAGAQDSTVAFSLADLARDVVATVRAIPRYAGRTLAVRADDDTNDLIDGRPGEIRQVILNLLFNALEATSEGGEVIVDISGSPDGQVHMSVIDNGRGMTAESLAHVFEPFFTDPAGKSPEAQRGTGLGLAITHAIISRHHGRIDARNNISSSSGEPGRGACFIVTLPAARGETP